MKTIKEIEKTAYASLKDRFGYKNPMAAPRFVKIVVNSATGSGIKRDPKRNELVMSRLAKITGQKPTVRAAKQSVASFKVRQGDPIGVSVTLRGARMYSFLEKFFNVSIPRTKDFRGIERRIVDDIGNLTLGIKEHTIFPEVADEELKDVFGLSLTMVTTAKTKDEALAFFDLIGFPFKK